MNSSTTANKPRLSSVALPAEHGSWAFLYEPLLLGLLVAPSGAGLWFALATAAFFLLRHPLKLLWLGVQRGLKTPKQQLAQQVAMVYAVVGLSSLGLAWAWAPSTSFITFLLGLLPLVGLVILADLRWGSRHLITELLAPAVLAGPAGGVVLLGGADYSMAFTVWLLLVGRVIPAVLLVRVLVQAQKQNHLSPWPPLLTHLWGLGFVGLGILWGWWSWGVGLVYGVLCGRAMWLLSAGRPELTVKQLGFVEVGFGLFTVSLLSLIL